MPVGTIGTDRSTGKAGTVGRGARGARSAGAGQGSALGRAGPGPSVSKSSGPLKSKDPDGHIGSANAAIGTYAQDRTALNAAYGGPIDDTGWLGRLLGYRTYKNPISNQYAGWGLDIGGLIGSGIGVATGIPGLGMLGSQLDITADFGPEFGAWRNGTGSTGTGSPGLGGGRGTGYVARGGIGAPGQRAGAAALPVQMPLPQTQVPASPIPPVVTGSSLPGYMRQTRFGTGNIQPYRYGLIGG